MDQFALEIGVSKPSLIKYEKGEIEIIPLGVAIKIAKALDEYFLQLFEIESYQVSSADQEALIKVLQDSENFLDNKVKELEKRIEEKDLVIDLLKREREIYKQSVLHSFEYVYSSVIRELESKLSAAETEQEKNNLKRQIENETRSKEMMLKNFTDILFLSKQDIEHFYSELKKPWETAFK